MAWFETSGARWVIVLSVGLASVALFLLGYGVLALVLLAVVGAVAVARRREPDQRVRVETCMEAARLPYSCDVVWALIKPAETAPIIEPSIQRGYHVAGTPLGLGERQAFEFQDGTTVVVEVVEYQPGQRAVTRVVSPPPTDVIRYVHSVEPIEGGCLYSTGYEIEVPADKWVDRQVERAWRIDLREQTERVRRSLAATDPTA